MKILYQSLIMILRMMEHRLVLNLIIWSVSLMGKRFIFPAGTYNLTEPIVLPLEYTKNVNLIFDKNATVKSDVHLEALIKVGYSETYFTDVSLRRFSYIEGGILDCYNADNGILINGRKQMVQIRTVKFSARTQYTYTNTCSGRCWNQGEVVASDTKS